MRFGTPIQCDAGLNQTESNSQMTTSLAVSLALPLSTAIRNFRGEIRSEQALGWMNHFSVRRRLCLATALPFSVSVSFNSD